MNLETILAHEALQEQLDSRISETALAYYEITNGKSLNAWDRRYAKPNYTLDRWERFNDTISATFECWYRGSCDSETISIPIAYLENDDWQEPLRQEIAKQAAEKARLEAEEKAQRKAQRAQKREEQERAEFLRLQTKYGE